MAQLSPSLFPNLSSLDMLKFQEDDWEQHRLDCGLTQKYMLNTSKYLLQHSEMPEKGILLLVSRFDANETLELPDRWPRTYTCEEIKCPKCFRDLTALFTKPQKNKSDKKLLITKLHVIEIVVFSKKCKNCHLIRSPDTLSYGLLNIGDLCLVSLDIFFSLRNTIR